MSHKLPFENIISGMAKERRRSEKAVFIYYIRLYTALIISLNYLDKIHYKQTISHLKVLQNFMRSSKLESEEMYLDRIKELVSLVLKGIKCGKCRTKNCTKCDRSHARTRLQLAQNICILRMLESV